MRYDVQKNIGFLSPNIFLFFCLVHVVHDIVARHIVLVTQIINVH